MFQSCLFFLVRSFNPLCAGPHKYKLVLYTFYKRYSTKENSQNCIDYLLTEANFFPCSVDTHFLPYLAQVSLISNLFPHNIVGKTLPAPSYKNICKTIQN